MTWIAFGFSGKHDCVGGAQDQRSFHYNRWMTQRACEPRRTHPAFMPTARARSIDPHSSARVCLFRSTSVMPLDVGMEPPKTCRHSQRCPESLEPARNLGQDAVALHQADLRANSGMARCMHETRDSLAEVRFFLPLCAPPANCWTGTSVMVGLRGRDQYHVGICPVSDRAFGEAAFLCTYA